MPEVTVVGGGVVGLAAAALLARSGVEVALVEQQRLPPKEPGPEPEVRVLALTPASEAILQACGAWRNLDPGRVEPWVRMRAWAQADHDGIEFLASDINQARLGHIVENTNLVRALHQALQEASVETYCPDSVVRLEPHASGADLTLESGAHLESRIVVVADGADSKTRALAGLDWDYHSYQERAIVAEVETGRPAEQTAWQRFTPDGPVALLPLFNHHYSLIWSTVKAETLMGLSPEEFENELANAFGGHLDSMRLHGSRRLFPLGRGKASHWCTGRVVLAGDAAHVVHPLAGLGQNLGLMDAAVLQEELVAHPLSTRALRAYERRRKGPVRTTQWVLEAFRLGFSHAGNNCRRAGGFALGLAGRRRALRRFFIHLADGRMDGPQWLRTGNLFPEINTQTDT